VPDEPQVSGPEAYRIDWAEQATHLAATAGDDRAWYASMAAELVDPADRLAVDVGCGTAGMTIAVAARMTGGRVLAVDADPAILASAAEHVRDAGLDPSLAIDLLQADLPDGVAAIRDALAGPANLVWASGSVHHLGDQQGAVTALAGLLATGGRLALAEGGLPARHLPWDVGTGEPGLEVRLDAAQDRWFARMRAELPDSVRMPYGWTEALRRAGLNAVTTRTTLWHSPIPLPDGQRDRVVRSLAHRVDRLRPTGLLEADDLAAWDRLLDPDDPRWLGHRDDLYRSSARSVHVGVHP
jgi:SAM-dependent methyltransferase